LLDKENFEVKLIFEVVKEAQCSMDQVCHGVEFQDRSNGHHTPNFSVLLNLIIPA
jgi:hypothetical protein